MSLKDRVDDAPPVELTDQELIVELEERGFIVTKDAVTERQIVFDAPRKGTARIGIVSDTHLGHRKQQLTYWRDFARFCSEQKVTHMMHGGDLVDGLHKMHRGMEYEQFRHGADGQARYAIDNIPEVKVGKKLVPYQTIGGNHDGSFWNEAGANILAKVAENRDDVHYLGSPAATFHLGPVRIYLMHPDGGVPYARSYRLQKIVEQFAPDDKPHICLLGHLHVTNHLPAYRNVDAFMLPCFQAQTSYLKRKGLAPVIGGLLLEVDYDEHGLLDVRTHWRIYRNPIGEDY